MVAVADIITTISASIGLVKELNSVDKKLDDATYKLTIAELTTKLADAQIGLTEVRDQLSEKDKEIEKLKAAFVEKSELIEVRGFYYRSHDDAPVGNALCPLCMQKDGLFVDLQSQGRNSICPNCKANFERKSRYLYPEQK